MAPSCATWAVAAGHIVYLSSASWGADGKEEGTEEEADGKEWREGGGEDPADGKDGPGGRRQSWRGGEGRRRQTTKIDGEADDKDSRGEADDKGSVNP